ncbi:heme exporter protein CcmD [Shewanella gelidii]|uniref:Heme exporter protein D n=1 Tax=Shewanella gelidii TaxID=1642821 RepID=A0A917JYS8_9GAMM|nr:heme exporter protein CcmD [Shewanella gelidii]MCL1099652.1 heme exporter protein CcmD [Shewanella gelidii]GGI92868.1 heme exporter protein D [Shewanella gelidii]
MQFDSIADFFNMGGYAFYVWLAYGVTFSSLSILIIVSAKRKKKVLTEISKKMVREERLKNNRSNKS